MSSPISLDRTGDPWVGVFVGLGRVEVHADGRIEVSVDDQPSDTDTDTDTDQPEDVELRRAALVNGWGEPLALLRTGYELIHGTALRPPANADQHSTVALVLTGHSHDVIIVSLGLLATGWQLIADRLVPVTWDDATGVLTAHPRPAPMLASGRRARAHGFDGPKVRGDTDARAIAVARCDTPCTVTAVVAVGTRRPHESVLSEPGGIERFDAASHLIAGGALSPEAAAHTAHIDDTAHADDTAPPTPSASVVRANMARHLELARLRYADLKITADTGQSGHPSSHDDDIAALLNWWAGDSAS